MNSIYNRQKIELQKTEVLNPQSYRGFSSIASSTSSFTVYDIELIKQDLLNYFNIRKGEKLENPEFGTIIWDMLFDPLTEEVIGNVVNKFLMDLDVRLEEQKVSIDVNAEFTFNASAIATAPSISIQLSERSIDVRDELPFNASATLIAA